MQVLFTLALTLILLAPRAINAHGHQSINPYVDDSVMADADESLLEEIDGDQAVDDGQPDEESVTSDVTVVPDPMRDEYEEEYVSQKITNMTELVVKSQDLRIFFGGLLRDDFVFLQNAYTLRKDYGSHNDYFEHKLNLNFRFIQGEKRFGRPAIEGFTRLSNYVLWQQESVYSPIFTDDININNLQGVIVPPTNVAARSSVPLVFAEQAWMKIHIDAFCDAFKKYPTFLKVGYFPYILGRGLVLGYHGDLAVDYLGWQQQRSFDRFPAAPPGILLTTQFTENWSMSFYYMLWKETNATISDVLAPTKAPLLNSRNTIRGSDRDRNTYVLRADYKNPDSPYGDLYFQPYWAYVAAPEQSIEFTADASAHIYTTGFMVNLDYNNLSVNVEIAGQYGHQEVRAIDRNVVNMKRTVADGSVKTSFSHVLLQNQKVPYTNPSNQAAAPAAGDNVFQQLYVEPYSPNNDFLYVTDSPANRKQSQQGAYITHTVNGAQQDIMLPGSNVAVPLVLQNSERFANKRFRKGYKLGHQGFMALADLDYRFETKPFKLGVAAGYISGDNYPYNEESDNTFHGFIPMRSRYRGLAVKNFLIFDRLAIPRPVNIQYLTYSAPNNIKDLSNLQFLQWGLTWYPLTNSEKMAVTTALSIFWEAATLNKWDNNGKHPDPGIEAQIEVYRQRYAFKGWESSETASKMLGTELDIKMDYVFYEGLECITKLALFIPGQLYKDLAGQPNDVTHRTGHNQQIHYDSLGCTPAWAFMLTLRYQF